MNRRVFDGFVYVIHSGGLYKIGSTRNIGTRILAYHTHNPKFRTCFVHLAPDCVGLETALHRTFKKKKVGAYDWFKLSQRELNLLKETCENWIGGVNI
jgi:hypothetical protein